MLKRRFLLVLCGVLIGYALQSPWLQPLLSRVASYSLYPIVWISNQVTLPLVSYFKKNESYEELSCAYEKLSREHEALRKNNVTLTAFFQNTKLYADLEQFRKRYKLERAVAGKIIARSLTSGEQWCFVDKGARDGISLDMVAIYKFQLLGRVVEVFEWYCKVMLITDRRCKVASFTNLGNARGIVQGVNKHDELMMEFVSCQIPVKDEDLVLSSGEGLVFPEGFCLGTIAYHTVGDTYHFIKIRPMVDMHTVSACLIINRDKVDIKA